MTKWHHNSIGNVWLVDEDDAYVDDLIIRPTAGEGWQVGLSPLMGDPPPPFPPIYLTLKAAKVAYLMLKGAGI